MSVLPINLSATKNERPQRPHQSQQGVERLKVVVRRLPPNLPEPIFWESVQPWVSEDTAAWREFYPGKSRKRLNKENIPSRAYIAFKNEQQLAVFSREYDGHVFRDKAGNESQAIVEFAPYPKVPTEKKKADARVNTIEKDDDLQSFLRSLENANKAEPVTIENLVASVQPAPVPKTTPLLESLKAEKAEKAAQKEREAQARKAAAEAKKEEAAKKKVAPKQQGAPAEGSKKGSKKAEKAAATAETSTKAQTPSILKPAKPPNPKARQAAVAQQQQQAQQQQAPSSQSTKVVAPATGPSSQSASPAPSSRQTRPVIGLGSRQFEAALSGAGVRKQKKDKEAAETSVQGTDKDQRPASPKSRPPRKKDPPPPTLAAAPAAGSEASASTTASGGSSRGRGKGRGRGRGAAPRGGSSG